MVRAYLLFFGDANTSAWWNAVTRPGFRHVCAAGYDAEAERWLFVDPHRAGMDVLTLGGDDALMKLGAWGQAANLILRFEISRARTAMPAAIGCVGAIKALLGVRSRALRPCAFSRHLLRHGAEIIEVSGGKPVRRSS